MWHHIVEIIKRMIREELEKSTPLSIRLKLGRFANVRRLPPTR